MHREAPQFHLIGNLSCLDLVNTEAMSQGEPVDLLADFGDLLAWLESAGVLTAQERRRAAARWEESGEGNAAFREAIELRGVLRATVARLTDDKPVTGEALAVINRVLASRPVYRRLARQGGVVVSSMETAEEKALHLLAPVAESAAWLLEHGDRSLLRRCENPNCVLYFYDTTKNARRRWCSMAACGSRAKAAAYYRRKREEG